MNILKRKTETRDEDISFDAVSISEAYAELAEIILAELETTDDTFRYELNKIEAGPFDPHAAEKEIASNGAFFGFGVDEKSTQALIKFDQSFSVFITDSSFGDVDLSKVVSKAKTATTDKLTLLLLNDITKIMQGHILKYNAALIHSEKNTSLDSFYFEESDAQFNRLSFDFLVKAAPSQKPAKGKPSDLALNVSLILPTTLISQMLEAHTLTKTTPDKASISIEDMQTFWSQRIDHSHTRLKLVLEEFKMSVADCTRLQIGDILPLPSVSLMEMKIHADFNDNEMCIANAALGIFKTNRAARLVSELDPAFLEGIDDLNGSFS